MKAESHRRVRARQMRTRVGSALVLLGLLASTACSGGEETPTSETPTTATPATEVQAGAGTAERSEGCGVEPDVDPVGDERPGDVALPLSVGGQERSYRLAVPASYRPDEPAPLILNLHGSGSDAIQQSVYSDLPHRGGERGFLTVTPDAIDGQWEMISEGDDDAFLVALLDDIEQRYCIDLDRVSVIGMSLGAWKAALTACNHPDRIASVALVTVEVHPNECAALPAIAFHGTADRTVPYGEGADPGIVVQGANATLPGARDNIAAWAAGAGCSPEPVVERIGTDVERRVYGDCRDGIGVELYTVEGADHAWPGSAITVAPSSQTIDATELSLDWFEAHPRRS